MAETYYSSFEMRHLQQIYDPFFEEYFNLDTGEYRNGFFDEYKKSYNSSKCESETFSCPKLSETAGGVAIIIIAVAFSLCFVISIAIIVCCICKRKHRTPTAE